MHTIEAHLWKHNTVISQNSNVYSEAFDCTLAVAVAGATYCTNDRAW